MRSRAQWPENTRQCLKPSAWVDDILGMDDPKPDELTSGHDQHNRRAAGRRHLTDAVEEDMRSGDRRRRPGMAGLLRDILRFGQSDDSKP
jgi:hypothetical protein